MLKGEFFKYMAYYLLAFITIVALHTPVPPSLMIMLHTSLTVYIASVNTATLKYHQIHMIVNGALMFPIIGSVILFACYCGLKYCDKYSLNFFFHFANAFLGGYCMKILLEEKIQQVFAPSEKCLSKVKKLSLFFMGICWIIYYMNCDSWVLNNLLGIIFSVILIEKIHLGNYKAGFSLLVIILVYDIFWVFFTEVMVFVAKNLNAPVKLIFPTKLSIEDPMKDFSMIGLGDIIVPGMYLALMLKYDMHRYLKSAINSIEVPFSVYNLPYFFVTLLGYFVGILLTLLTMSIYRASQPAMLYITPACLLSSLTFSVLKQDLFHLWNFDLNNLLKREEN